MASERPRIALPQRLAAAAPDLLTAALFLWCWIEPTAWRATLVSELMLVIPVVGVFSGMLFLGEHPGWPEYAALALVLASLATVVVPQRKAAQ